MQQMAKGGRMQQAVKRGRRRRGQRKEGSGWPQPAVSLASRRFRQRATVSGPQQRCGPTASVGRAGSPPKQLTRCS